MSVYDPAYEFDPDKESTMRNIRLIVAGSRDVVGSQYVLGKLDEITADLPHNQIEVVSGGARGVDRLGEAWAVQNDIPITHFIPDWKRFGRSAGYRRNEDMANYGTHLVAIWDGQSRGTKHMIDIARKAGLEVRIVRADVDGAIDHERG